MGKDLFIKTLIEKFCSKKKIEEVKKRANDIDSVLNIISSNSLELQDTSDFSRIEFAGSVERFLLGAYLDSIYFAITSVEIALLLRLDQRLTKEEKKDLSKRNLTFGTIIRHSKSRGIIGSEFNEDFNNLLIARNSHFHPATFLSGLVIQEKKTISPQLDEGISNLQSIKEKFPILYRIKLWRDSYDKLYNLFLEKKEVLENLNDLEWATPLENRKLIEKEVDEVIEEYRKSVDYLLPYGRDQPFKMLMSLRGLKNRYLEVNDENNYLKKRAKRIILNALKCLQHLEFY